MSPRSSIERKRVVKTSNGRNPIRKAHISVNSPQSDKHSQTNIDIDKSKTFREDQIRERQEKEL